MNMVTVSKVLLKTGDVQLRVHIVLRGCFGADQSPKGNTSYTVVTIHPVAIRPTFGSVHNWITSETPTERSDTVRAKHVAMVQHLRTIKSKRSKLPSKKARAALQDGWQQNLVLPNQQSHLSRVGVFGATSKSNVLRELPRNGDKETEMVSDWGNCEGFDTIRDLQQHIRKVA